MTTYYLMPFIGTSVSVEQDRIRRMDCSAKASEIAAEKYEREMNGGKTYDELFHEAQLSVNPSLVETAFRVSPVPQSQARNYRDFHRWHCNKEARVSEEVETRARRGAKPKPDALLRKQRTYYLTDTEHAELRKRLIELRKKDESK